MPPPEDYDDWDPAEHDREYERLQEVEQLHWRRDLRNLRSEIEAERAMAAYRARNPGDDYRSLREAFVADNPEPPAQDYDGRAEWEWRLNAFVYEGLDNDPMLHRHRMERASYIERVAERLRRAQEWADEFWRPLKEAPRPLKPREPVPWPVGDGLSEWRRQRGEPGVFGDVLPDAAFDEPSYAACLDLEAGLQGWRFSFRGGEFRASKMFRETAQEAVTEITSAYEPEYLPGNVGRAQLHLRDGVLLCQDALDLLDGLSGYDWLTPPAYARLRELVEAARDAAAERYAELRAIYDAYYARAVRLLGVAGAPDHPPASTAELPAYYDDFDPDAHDVEAERLEYVALRHWQDDLRNLRSEVEAERYVAKRRARLDGSRHRALREAFTAENPEPSRDDPKALAEWKWRLEEYIFVETDNSVCLHRHRLERGAYIERYRTMLQQWKDQREEARRLAEEAPPRPAEPDERPPWPVGDGVSEIRRQFAEDAAEYGDDEPEGALDEPSYDRALDLRAGATGWLESLEQAHVASGSGLFEALSAVESEITSAYEPEDRPGTVGTAQGRLRAGILHAEDALDLLDDLRGEPWLTDAACDRLCELVEAARDAATERYAELRATYDAYRERALRILGPEGVAGV